MKRNIFLVINTLFLAGVMTAYIWTTNVNSWQALLLSIVLVPLNGIIFGSLIITVGQKIKSPIKAIMDEKSYLTQTAKMFFDFWCYFVVARLVGRFVPVLSSKVYAIGITILILHAILWASILNASDRSIIKLEMDRGLIANIIFNSMVIFVFVILVEFGKITSYSSIFVAMLAMAINFIVSMRGYQQ